MSRRIMFEITRKLNIMCRETPALCVLAHLDPFGAFGLCTGDLRSPIPTRYDRPDGNRTLQRP
jgi:hypothetical protein